MKQEELLDWITNGENSGIEFKRDDGVILHVETLPVPRTGLMQLDMRRLEDYCGRIRRLDPLPQTEAEWTQLLVNLEYMTGQPGRSVCTKTTGPELLCGIFRRKRCAKQ